jgi:hypothetical protein
MSDQADITGRDTYVLVEALSFTVEALSELPIELRPDNNIAEMKRLIEEFVKHDAGLAEVQKIARRRLGTCLPMGRRMVFSRIAQTKKSIQFLTLVGLKQPFI